MCNMVTFFEMYHSTLLTINKINKPILQSTPSLKLKIPRTTHSNELLDSHVFAIDVAFEHNAKATFSQFITSSWFWSGIKIICNAFQVMKQKILEIWKMLTFSTKLCFHLRNKVFYFSSLKTQTCYCTQPDTAEPYFQFCDEDTRNPKGRQISIYNYLCIIFFTASIVAHIWLYFWFMLVMQVVEIKRVADHRDRHTASYIKNTPRLHHVSGSNPKVDL